MFPAVYAASADLGASAHGLGAFTDSTSCGPLTSPVIGHMRFSMKANTGHHFSVCLVFHYTTTALSGSTVSQNTIKKLAVNE